MQHRSMPLKKRVIAIKRNWLRLRQIFVVAVALGKRYDWKWSSRYEYYPLECLLPAELELQTARLIDELDYRVHSSVDPYAFVFLF